MGGKVRQTMNQINIEKYSEEIVKSKPTERVVKLIDAIRENMLVKNKKVSYPAVNSSC